MNPASAEAFPVGEQLLEELDQRGWTQAEFAEILGRPAQVISEIISGKKEITRESAAQIAAALGTSPEFWLNFQDRYHLWRQAQDADTRKQLEDVKLRARLKELAPISVLRKRGVITETSTEGQARQLCQLFGLTDIYEPPRLPMAARRSNLHERVSTTQMTWLACIRRRAEQIHVAPHSKHQLLDLARQLSGIVRNPASFTNLPGLFAEVGVRLVYEEAFPSSKIDGASFTLEGTPVIGLSGRGHRLDKVLFTLLHETAHVYLDHIADEVVLDDAEHVSEPKREHAANELAAEWILPAPLPAIPDRVGQPWLTNAANTLGVHPIVIVGRLQNRGVLTWRSALAKDAPAVSKYLLKW
ncbi:HigA family addiction module antitoxin [Actinophytocola sp.]|uniref:HigA family addiction module antitoxin n=1 Tax=Actinophytocola sp. TaxID=1872138 RepID=UPI00389B00B5